MPGALHSILKFFPLIPRLSVTAFAAILFSHAPARTGTAHADIPDIRDAYGVAIADFNQNGLPDIYLVGFRTLNRLLINEGEGVFRDRSISAGVGGNLMPQGIRNLELGASAVDFDNDGKVDLLICGWGESLDLLHNQGDGTFRSVTKKMGLRHNLDANMGIWGDLDGDGFPDLLLTNETGPMRLYRNDKGVRLISISLDSAGLASDSGSQGALFADFNLNGRLDLAISGWKHPLRLYEQVAPFRFRPIPVDLPDSIDVRTNAILPGDIDNDGDVDFLVTVRHGRDWLFVNQLNPSKQAASPSAWNLPPKSAFFFERGLEWGLSDSLDSYGGAFADFKGDGRLDLVVTSRGPIVFFKNSGNGFHRRPLEEVGISNPSSSYNTGFMFADLLPAPGYEMVFASRDSSSSVQPGPMPRKRMIEVKLKGVRSNSHAVGAHLSLWERHLGATKELPWDLKQSLQVHGNHGYLSSYLGSYFFAADGDTSRDLRVRVQFPSGKVVVRRVPPDSTKSVVVEVHESGVVAALWARGLRVAYQSARDPQRRRFIFLALIGVILTGIVLRASARAMARSMARKHYTQELETKNAELRQLLEELSHTQRQLIHSEKMAGLGQLVAGIAHELNNPIGFIYANLHQIQKYLDRLQFREGQSGKVSDNSSEDNLNKAQLALKESQEGAVRIRDIVQNLWGISRRGSGDPARPLQKKSSDLNRLLEKSLLLARTNFSKNIVVEKNLGRLPSVLVDETQIQQVFLNILVNAGQALGEKGRITIITGIEEDDVTVSLRDNGPGIDAENRDRIFEPFFTTKPVGQGIGLGLHICYEIMKAHGGSITAQPAPGGGAEFLIKLPREKKG